MAGAQPINKSKAGPGGDGVDGDGGEGSGGGGGGGGPNDESFKSSSTSLQGARAKADNSPIIVTSMRWVRAIN